MRSEYTKLLELVERSPGILARGYETRLPGLDAAGPGDKTGTGAGPDAANAGRGAAKTHPAGAKDLPSDRDPGSAQGPVSVKSPGPAQTVQDVPAKSQTRDDLLPLVALERSQAIEGISALVRDCKLCRLCEKRNKAVPGTGSLTPAIMVIGEGP